jgi:hypothetical protein
MSLAMNRCAISTFFDILGAMKIGLFNTYNKDSCLNGFV